MDSSRILRSGRALAAALALAAVCGPSRGQVAPTGADYGPLTITGYELREARFSPRPYRELKQGVAPVEHAFGWTVSIRGPRFPQRALDPVLWVDSTPINLWDREQSADEERLVFVVTDPALLRAEHQLTVIYGKDERTRTSLLERLDPERLVRLAAGQREGLAFPELESLTIDRVDESGKVAGHGRIAGGRLALGALLPDGRVVALKGAPSLGADGRFALDAGPLPAGATHVVAFRLESPEIALPKRLTPAEKGVELLDSKPVGAKPAAR